ncbi:MULTISPECIES: DUF262 domain-containing protein [Aeromonas]|uniref:DUF262 domain-containing protein n=1 Tax=Aeromonas TaxID=642 RepID=UPI0020B35C7E|nr:DUF262 domain-containing protein [Aeromonas hydrophila]MCP3324112.1 DUF262 domain-containing HNH endonuclease family protein [Aeromonas hydrophila]HCT2508164.1 DUF262 domain-containing protein [Aeromonas dhakensis]
MAVENFLNAETESFGGIIKGDNQYIVPIYQRDYSWEPNNWDDLWLDIENNRANKNKHYMGSIVLVARENKQYEIIDGQQRLTTLTILILSIIDTIKSLIDKKIDVDNNQKRVDLLTSDYIGKKSLKSLNYENKIQLNEHNNPFFSTYITNGRKVNNLRSEHKSNKLLMQCFDYFKKKIRDDVLKDDNIEHLISFVEYISDNLLFIKISATDDLSAYLIFETLNDRGLELSVTDLLKNYLFSIVDDTDRPHVKNIWDATINYVSYSGFPKFLRHYWMMQNGILAEKELYKVVKQNVNTAKSAFKLLEDMSEVAEIYQALNDYNHDLWSNDEKVKKHIRELNMFNVTQCYPLLLNSYLYLDKDEWIGVLRICSIISFRYMVISGLNPNALESKYNDACKSINIGTATTARDIFNILKPIYVNDEDFVRNFESASIKTRKSSKQAKYIIYSIENHINNSSLDYEFDNGTLEHILPENPTDEWFEFFPRDSEESFIYKIGNFTILEPDANRVIGNKTYTEKKPHYEKSRYAITKQIAFKIWNPDNILYRQKNLAKQAKAIWSLNYD